MLRVRFEQELQRLVNAVLELGEMVGQALGESVDCLRDRDLECARRITAGDLQINSRRFRIEADVLVLIATQQPMGRDLRALAAILDIIRELERTGDYAKGIAKISLNIGEQELVKPLSDIPQMAALARDMLKRALKAYVEGDVEVARAIPMEDDRVDDLYNRVRRDLMTIILADPAKIEQSNMLLWAAHNLERAADRVTNICERIVFMHTGELADLPNTAHPLEPHDI